MHLDLVRDNGKVFPTIDNPLEIRSLRIWHCKYSSLVAISELKDLEELVIGSFPDETFECIASLLNLHYLKIMHLPKVSEITVLKELKKIKSLSLSTLPAWDSSGKITIVESLVPIASISELCHIELFGVCPPDKSLKPLEQCKALKTARFSRYPSDEIERFYQITGVKNAFNPAPSFG